MRGVLVVAAAAIAVAGCGKGGTHYTLAKTKACLRSAGVAVGGPLDFVATTATGGAVRARLRDNAVTVVFGDTTGDADGIHDAYVRFHARNVGIADVLRQQANAVMLWQAHPSDADVATITNCLK